MRAIFQWFLWNKNRYSVKYHLHNLLKWVWEEFYISISRREFIRIISLWLILHSPVHVTFERNLFGLCLWEIFLLINIWASHTRWKLNFYNDDVICVTIFYWVLIMRDKWSLWLFHTWRWREHTQCGLEVEKKMDGEGFLELKEVSRWDKSSEKEREREREVEECFAQKSSMDLHEFGQIVCYFRKNSNFERWNQSW
jgi:hypothetical protein